MNYIEMIRNFWRSHEEHSFAITEIALYFHLLEICNNCQWKNPFKRNNAKIMADLGIKDRRTLDSARNRLVQLGLIKINKNSTNPNVTYTLTTALNAQANVQVPAQVSVQGDVQVSAQADDTKDKLNKTKLNNIGGEVSPRPPQKSLEEKIEERKKREAEFYQSLIPFAQAYPRDMLRKFFDCWSEPNKSGTQMRFELEKTWDVEKRLARWQKNDWSESKNSNAPQTTNPEIKHHERQKAEQRTAELAARG